MTKEHPERPLLDTIRWLSAFMVAFGHALGLVISKDLSSPMVKIAYYVSDLRHPCVILFFVLSGYLVGGGVLRRSDRIDIKKYWIARFSRIYIVLIPAIILTILLDGIAFYINSKSPVYSSVYPSGVLGGTPLFDRYNLWNAIATILSLENVVGDPIGSAAPLWSLGYEWIFYFTFPALIVATNGFGKIVRYAVFAAALAGLIVLGRAYFAVFFCIWIAGACAGYLSDKQVTPPLLQRAALALSVITFLATPLIPQRIADPALGILFSIYLSAFNPSTEKGLNLRIDKSLSAFSYSLYVTHLPVMVFTIFILSQYFGMPSSGLHVSLISTALLIALMIFSAGIAYAFGNIFERRTDDLKRFMLKKLAH